MALSDLVHLVRPAAGDAQGALVLLHGRGTSEQDLFPLLDALDPERRLVGLTPRGPLSLPPGGAHWYAVRQIGYPDPSTFHPTFDLLAGWLDSIEPELGVPMERTILGGFSQGTVMSYALGLGKGRPSPAGIIGLSGFMPTVDDFELDLSNREGYPVAIGHGTYDPIIGVEWGHQARDRLTQAGVDVLWRESPMPHSVDPGFLRELQPWVTTVLTTDD